MKSVLNVSVALVVALLVAIAAQPAAADVDHVYYDSGTSAWVTQTGIFAGPAPGYAGITYNGADGGSDPDYLAIKFGGGVDRIYYDSGTSTWITEVDVVPGTYTAVGRTGHPNYYDCFGVKPDGDVDRFYKYLGSWYTEPDLRVGDYVDVAMNDGGAGSGPLDAFLLKSNGNVDRTYWNGASWVLQVNAFTGGDYVRVGRANDAYGTIGVDADGNLDRLYYSGGFQTEANIAVGDYVDVAYDGAGGRGYFAAKASGGVDRVYWDAGTSAWVIEADITTGVTYTSVAGDGSALGGAFLYPPPTPAAGTVVLVR